MGEAVQQALMRHGVLLDAQALVSASAIAGSVAAALPFLPQGQRLAITSLKGGWAELASEFFRTMAEKIARSDQAGAESVDEGPTS